MNTRKIIAALIGLLLIAAAITSITAATAKAAASNRMHRVTLMGVTSSGQIINLSKPPAWLKPNTLVHPLNSISPDQLIENAQICDANDKCINDWNGGGQGTLLRFYSHGVTNNDWNWWYEGTVSGQQSWPFTPGTNINNAYNTNPVYKFAFAPNGNGSGNCISQQLFGPGDGGSNLNTTSCACSTCQLVDGSKYQYFVLDGNGRLVAVKATNIIVQSFGDNTERVWVGYNNPGDGNGNYVFLVSNIRFSLTWAATF